MVTEPSRDGSSHRLSAIRLRAVPVGGRNRRRPSWTSRYDGVRFRQLLQAMVPGGRARALFGGPQGGGRGRGARGDRAASLVGVQPIKKMVGESYRPDRVGLGVPVSAGGDASSDPFRRGHSASAAAFAVAVGEVVPTLSAGLRGAAAVVAFSGDTGGHYPSDVLVGATVGALFGRLAGRRRPRFGPSKLAER